MGISQRDIYLKQPFDEFPVVLKYNYAGVPRPFPGGASEIVSATATAVKWHEDDFDNITDATAEILRDIDAVEVSKNTVSVYVNGGVDRFDYKITVQILFNKDVRIEEDLFIRVREK